MIRVKGGGICGSTPTPRWIRAIARPRIQDNRSSGRKPPRFQLASGPADPLCLPGRRAGDGLANQVTLHGKKGPHDCCSGSQAKTPSSSASLLRRSLCICSSGAAYLNAASLLHPGRNRARSRTEAEKRGPLFPGAAIGHSYPDISRSIRTTAQHAKLHYLKFTNGSCRSGRTH
jgi:hypothetical protein